MKTCTRCGLINPDSSSRCECGGPLAAGEGVGLVEGRVAGFWIRLGADLLDALVLGAIGLVIALAFRAALLRLGERAAIIGAPLTLLYTGVLQSHIGRGQTIAKRLLGLRVLRLDGGYLSLDRSLVRWAIIGIMSYGGAVAIALASVAPFVKVQSLAAALGGTQLALILGCALLVPFHPLKRGLHDLLTGSIVIRGGGKIPVDLVARLHNPRRDRVIVGVAVAVAVIGTVVGAFASHNVPTAFEPAARVMTSVSQLGIENPGVVDSFIKGPNGSFHNIVVTGYLPTNADGTPRIEKADEKVLALVRENMPLDGVDSIVINLRKGINLGVYSSYESTTRTERAVPGGDGR
jgi:uncharacterized RDD family membrane protein YckC